LLDNRSEFSAPLEVSLQREGEDYVGEVSGAVAVANTIAFVSEAVDPISIFPSLTRRDLMAQVVRYLLFANGDQGRAQPVSATLKKIVLLFAAFTIIVFLVFLFNQTVQIVTSARTVNATLGGVVFWALIVLYCTSLLTPVVLWFRMPKRILPPVSTEGDEYASFLAGFKKRMSRKSSPSRHRCGVTQRNRGGHSEPRPAR